MKTTIGAHLLSDTRPIRSLQSVRGPTNLPQKRYKPLLAHIPSHSRMCGLLSVWTHGEMPSLPKGDVRDRPYTRLDERPLADDDDKKRSPPSKPRRDRLPEFVNSRRPVLRVKVISTVLSSEPDRPFLCQCCHSCTCSQLSGAISQGLNADIRHRRVCTVAAGRAQSLRTALYQSHASGK